MASWRDAFLKLSAEGRKRYAEMYCKHTRKVIIGKLPVAPDVRSNQVTRKEIIDYMKQNRVTSLEKLKQLQENDPNAPTIEEINFFFYGWNKLLRRLRFDSPSCFYPDGLKDEDILQFCFKAKVQSLEDYDKLKRTELGGFLPSRRQIYNRFGNFQLFIALINTYDIDAQLDKFFIESIKRGKPLCRSECASLGIEIDYLKSIMTEKMFQMVMHEKELQYRKMQMADFLRDEHEPLIKVFFGRQKGQWRKKRKKKTDKQDEN